MDFVANPIESKDERAKQSREGGWRRREQERLREFQRERGEGVRGA